MKGDHLGEFEELTLLAVRAIGEGAYAVPVQRYLESATNRTVTMGAVYAALDRLERKGLVQSAMGEPTRERGGKAKRLFSVTREGLDTVRYLRRVRERIWRAIEEGR